MSDGEPTAADPSNGARSGDQLPSEKGEYRWKDPDSGEGGYECLGPGGLFPAKNGKSVHWTRIGDCR